MPTFDLIDSKPPVALEVGDNIIHEDKFWRVVENYGVLGYPSQMRRMLVIIPSHLVTHRGFKFLEITTEHKIDAYSRTE